MQAAPHIVPLTPCAHRRGSQLPFQSATHHAACSQEMDPAAPGVLGVWREMGGHLSEPPKGGEHAQSCRSSAKGARAGAVGSGEAAEGLLTHLTAACKEVGAAIWREDLVCRLSNMEGANLRRRLAEQGSICTRQEGSAGTTLCSPLPDPAVPRSLSLPATFHHPPPPCCHLGWGEDVFHFRQKPTRLIQTNN